MRTRALLLGIALSLTGCPQGGASGLQSSPAGESGDPRRERALAAAQALGQKLKARLSAAIQEGGPSAGIATCKVAAPEIAALVMKDEGLRIGRTSFKLRNPGNAPPSWAESHVAARVETPTFSEAEDGTLQALLPIRMGGLCVVCHGPRESLSQDVQEALQAGYPTDQATGFQADELRGWFWVEVP